MKISEIFYSFSGEGQSTGRLAAFVRVAGCNLRCKYCDTIYAVDRKEVEESSQEMDADLVYRELIKYPVKFVIITGGEPLLYASEVIYLQLLLAREGYLTEIYTNGTLPIWKCSSSGVWSIDVKGPSSGNADSFLSSNLEMLKWADQIKFVIADRKDFDYALNWLNGKILKCSVLFQPAWSSDHAIDRQMIRWVKAEYPSGRISQQTHKYIYGDKRGV